jgi:hypothetical protein
VLPFPSFAASIMGSVVNIPFVMKLRRRAGEVHMLREENAKLREVATRSTVSGGSSGDNAVLLEAL